MNLVRSKTKVKTGRNGSRPLKSAKYIAADEKMDKNDIRELAYEFFAVRGYVHGNDLGDWFRAERTISETVDEKG